MILVLKRMHMMKVTGVMTVQELQMAVLQKIAVVYVLVVTLDM